MTIANSGHDERGRYSGGIAGDQTGGEWETRAWYNRPWNCVARFGTKIGEDIALLAKHAAANNKIGYDQSQRTTFWNKLKNAKNYDPANITVACEADCSAGVAAIVKAVGYRKGVKAMKNVSESTYTGNEVSHLKAAGATILTAPKYLTSDKYLKPGDILINEAHHTAINLTTGSGIVTKADTTHKTPAAYKQYKVVAIGGLYYRTGAGTNYKSVGVYSYGTIVNVSTTKTVNGRKWGKCKNGYWCCLDYCKVV